MTSNLRDLSVSEFTKEIASKSSVPGGGGASALVSAVAVALGNMVGQFTVGKKKYIDVEPEIISLMEKSEILRVKLLECIDEDAVAFEPLSKAYGLPKDDPDRQDIMEKCLRDAAAVPYKILQLSCEGVEILGEFAKKGSVLMISDAATGAAMLQGAIKGAAINVRVNTKLMKDFDYAQELNSKVDELVEKYTIMSEEIFNDVLTKMK